MAIDLVKQLQEQVKMLKDIIAGMPGHVYWTDKNGVYLGCNDIQAKAAGRSIKDFVGKTPKDMPWLSKDVSVQENITNINNLVLKGETIVAEEIVIRPDGVKLVFLSNKRPLYNSKKEIIGMFGISIDITERKQNKQLSIENEKHLAQISAQEVFKKCIDNIHNTLEISRLHVVNQIAGINHYIKDEEIYLTKREEQVLYLISMGKKPKQIANILSNLDNKRIATATITVIINKHLYLKFKVNDTSSLIEKAKILNLIPFLHDSFIDLI
jgi:PAS domain S-box-containing protein